MIKDEFSTEKISGEETYPIYSVFANWTEEKEDGVRSPNSTAVTFMTKDPATVEEKSRYIESLRESLYSHDRRRPIKDIQDLDLHVKFIRRETWYCTWFTHQTFDTGKTDHEVLESFERYVTRYELIQDYYPNRQPEDYVCLMGAEDRWRWRAGSGPEDESLAPCRCDKCKSAGVIRISH